MPAWPSTSGVSLIITLSVSVAVPEFSIPGWGLPHTAQPFQEASVQPGGLFSHSPFYELLNKWGWQLQAEMSYGVNELQSLSFHICKMGVTEEPK